MLRGEGRGPVVTAERVPDVLGGPDTIVVRMTLSEAKELQRIGLYNLHRNKQNDLALALTKALIPEKI